jgi:hypothetical protein
MSEADREGQTLYEIAARIDLSDDNVTCFDPSIVIGRLSDEMPECVACLHDYAWKDYEAFLQAGASEDALQVAENDALRRGPIFIFRLRTNTSQVTLGTAERYWVRIWSKQEIPEDFKLRFLAFLRSLRSAPWEIKSVRLENNEEFAA